MKLAFLTATVLATLLASPCYADQVNTITVTAARAAVIKLCAAIRKNPGELSIRKNLVEMRLQAGDSSTAADEMQQLVRVGLRQPQDFCLLGDAYRRAGRVSSAILNYQEALNILPNYTHAQAGMALCYSQAGCPKTGQKVLRQALSGTRGNQERRELLAAIETIKETTQFTTGTALPVQPTQM